MKGPLKPKPTMYLLLAKQPYPPTHRYKAFTTREHLLMGHQSSESQAVQLLMNTRIFKRIGVQYWYFVLFFTFVLEIDFVFINDLELIHSCLLRLQMSLAQIYPRTEVNDLY